MAEKAPNIIMSSTVGNPNTKQKGIRDYSETEADYSSTIDQVNAYSEKLAKQWEEREKKEGVRMYFAPKHLEDPTKKRFKTKKGCLNYIRREYPEAFEIGQKTGDPIKPIEIIVSPKRTAADFLPPEIAKRQMEMEKSAKESQVKLKTIDGSGNRSFDGTKAISIVNKPAIMAKEDLRQADDAIVIACAKRAWQYNKREILRACRQECERRGINPGV